MSEPPPARPLCDLCRREDAIGELDGELRCPECVELELERAELVAILPPELARRLPTLVEQAGR